MWCSFTPRTRSSRAVVRAVVVLFAVFATVFVVTPVAAQGEVTVTVTPTPAVAGLPVTVTAFGFAPGEMVTVEFGGDVIVSGYADDEGFFESAGVVSATMPEGGHPLDVTGDMGSYATLEVVVTTPPPSTTTTTTTTTVAPVPAAPSVRFSDPVPAGTTTVVSGTGFRPAETVTIEFGGAVVGRTVANEMGDWSLAITVDSAIPVGGHPIDVTGDAGSVVNGELVVAPSPPTTTVAANLESANQAPTTTAPAGNTAPTTTAPAANGGSSADTPSTDSPTTETPSTYAPPPAASSTGEPSTPATSTDDSSTTDGSVLPGSGEDSEDTEFTIDDGEFGFDFETGAIERSFDRDGNPIGGDTTGTRTGSTGAGGVPWGRIGVALALLATAMAYAATRTRRNCDPEKAAYDAADAAYDPAKRASDYYQGEYEYYRAEHAQLQREMENPLPPPVLGYYGESAEDQAHAQQIFDEQQAEWEMLEQRAERARSNINGAREAMDEARAERDEADAALAAAREALEAARIALMDCEGCAPPPKAETERGGAETSAPPSVSSAAPAVAPRLCLEGSSKGKVERTEQFRVLAGDVDIDVPTAPWAGLTDGGSIDPDALGGLDSGALEELFSDLESRPEATTTGYTIPTRIITVKYIRVLVCNGGGWVETDQVNRVEESSEAPPITFRQKSKDARRTARMVGEAQAHVAELQANAEAASAALAQ
jgi:hypothetical protein